MLALGVGAPIVARTVGVRLPIYPAKGYSSTFPLKAGGLAPTISGVDEQWLVGWSRLGDRLRLTSTAEFAGYDWGWTPRDFNNILKLARDLFPDAADYDRGRVPRVPATDDAGRAADPRPGPPPESLLQLRARPHGLDDGLRHRAHRHRPHDRADARPRHRGPDRRALTRGRMLRGGPGGAVRPFWDAFVATARPTRRPRFYEAFHFDDHEASANELADLVLSGVQARHRRARVGLRGAGADADSEAGAT